MPFKKGNNANPKGRPKNEDSAANAIRTALKDKDWGAMTVALYDTVMNPETKGKDKAACYNALADRAFGKPVQKQIIQELPTPPIDNEQVRAMQEAMGLPVFSQEDEATDEETE